MTRFRLVPVIMGLSALVLGPSAGASGSDAPVGAAEVSYSFEVKDFAADAGISRADAAHRLEVQRRALAAMPQVETAAGGAFGGVWFDSATHRFQVALSTTAPESLRSAVLAVLSAAELGADSDLVTVRRSRHELLVERDAVRRQLAVVNEGAPHAVQASLDESRNAVRVVVPRGVPLNVAQTTALADLRKRHVVENRPAPLAPVACNVSGPLRCDAPLRGGVQLHWSLPTPPGGGGACTVAFNAVSKSNGLPYAITAGHCFRSGISGPVYSYLSNNSIKAVGNKHSSYYDSAGDMALVSVSDSSWGPKPHVAVLDRADTSLDLNYYISSDAGSALNMRICYTGSSSRNSDCGTVRDTDTPYDDPTSTVTVAHTGYADQVCGIIGGDSGGPLYGSHTAYGLIISGGGSACSLWYQGIHGAESRLNVNVVHGTS